MPSWPRSSLLIRASGRSGRGLPLRGSLRQRCCAIELSQRALAEKLGVSQPRVVKLESGEHNPEVDTIINAVRRLGIEFVLDVAPASRKPALVTARAQKRGAIAHEDVSVVAASSV